MKVRRWTPPSLHIFHSQGADPDAAALQRRCVAEARTDLVNPQHNALAEKLDQADVLCDQVTGTREFRSNAAIFKGLSEAGLEQAKRFAVGISKYTPDAFVSKLVDLHSLGGYLFRSRANVAFPRC